MTEKGKKTVGIATSLGGRSLFHTELDGDKNKMSVAFSGVNSVKDFSDSQLLLRCRGFFVKLSGEGLRLRIFEDGTLSVEGKILGLEMVYDRIK